MLSNQISNNYEKPFHTHYGNNLLRYFSIFILVGLILISIYLINYAVFLLILTILLCLVGLLCIRFPRISLFNNNFEIVKKSFIKQFDDKAIFKYDELKSVEFSKGFTNWTYLFVLAILGSGGPGGNSKADQMIIKTLKDKEIYFNRFGSKNKFVKTISLINSKIETSKIK